MDGSQDGQRVISSGMAFDARPQAITGAPFGVAVPCTGVSTLVPVSTRQMAVWWISAAHCGCDRPGGAVEADMHMYMQVHMS